MDGHSQRGELSYRYTAGLWRVAFQYEAEVDDRRGLRLGDEFFSESPTRHGVDAQLTYWLTPSLSVDWAARYRHSRFAGVNRQVEGVTIVGQRRVDQLAQGAVAAALRLDTAWRLRLDYRYSDNRSTVERYDYDRKVLLLRLDRTFD